MLSVEVQFQIETLHCDGLMHLELPDLSIRQEIGDAPQKMLERAMQDFEERLRMCVRQEGRHLTDITFRT